MKSLADRFAEAAAAPRQTTDRSPASYRALDLAHQRNQLAAAAIKSAQRFVISADVREACRQLLLSRPSSLVEACRFARPPFERCWLEWETPNHPDPIHPVRVRVQQIGALVECAPGTLNQAFTVWTAWSYNRYDPANSFDRLVDGGQSAAEELDLPGLGVSAVELGLDFTVPLGAPLARFTAHNGWTAPRPQTEEDLRQLRNDHYNNIRYALKDPAERDALKLLLAPVRWRTRPDPLSAQQMAYSMSFGKDGVIAAIDDVRDEIGPLLSALILMNSKNCVERQPYAPPPALIKARLKRGLKPPPLDHTIVNIHLSPSQARIAAAHGLTREEMRQHKVRGHFKTRKTGVFWWCEYQRGDPAKKVEHDYRVTL
jgi:hypothetical protein